MAGPLTWELAEDLGARQGRVALLTGHPDTLAKGSTDGVKLFPAIPYERGSFSRRVISWLRYMVQAFFWLWRWPAEIPLLLYSNPPMLCWLGLVVHTLRGTRYAVMVHDIYPDVLIKLAGYAETHPLPRIWRRLNRAAYQHAELVMTLGECMAAALSEQFDPGRTPAGKVEVIYPWADTAKVMPLAKADNWFARQHEQVGKLTAMYSGNMGLGHDIESMLAAARELRDLPDVHFMFVGAGPKWTLVQQTLQAESLPNVTLLGWQPEEALPYMLACADVALVSLEPEMEGLAVPSKSVFALAAGSALVALAGPGGELAQWISRYRCGRRVGPDTHELSQALSDYHSQPAALLADRLAAREAAETAFDRGLNTDLAAELLSRRLKLPKRSGLGPSGIPPSG
jgi:glycosyltransferase involved in cell wall biosynthesis